MSSEQFFIKRGPFPLRDVIKTIQCSEDFSNFENFKVYGIETLDNAKDNEMTFLNSSKYKDLSLKTKAAACITSPNLSKFLPKKCVKINVKNILFSVTQVSKMFYPTADVDYPDLNLLNLDEIKNKYPDVKFGKNVLVGKNVDIGKNTFIGSNTIIESNVKIGEKCIIGSSVVIKNSLLSNNVHIQDGSKIGVKGFGFIPSQKENIRTPHIGKVILKDGVEVGANCTIDRGSLDNTVIEKNTFLDNQIHVAHNVKIGKNCIITGQVGFAGSSSIGDKVMIGGQAGISGHLKIGNNVKIAGGSGVIKNIPDNSKVMGYPAKNIRTFLKENM